MKRPKERIRIRHLIERDGRWFGGQERFLVILRHDGSAIMSPALKRFNSRHPELAMPLGPGNW